MIVSNEGNKGFADFGYIYCTMCKNKSLFPFMADFADMLPEHATIEDVLGNWDKIKRAKKFNKNKYHKDICGCLIPNDPNVKAGPNAKRFIGRPANHAGLHQKFVSPNAGSSSASEVIPKKSRPENTLASSSGTLSVNNVVEVCVTDKETGRKSTKFLRNNGKSLKTTSITSYMDRDVDLRDPSKNDIDLWAKKFVFDVVLTGCQKMVSQAASLTFYNAVILINGFEFKHIYGFRHEYVQTSCRRHADIRYSNNLITHILTTERIARSSLAYFISTTN